MKIYVYFCLHIFVCVIIGNLVHSKAISRLDSIIMLKHAKEPKTICGSNIGDTLDHYCKIMPNSGHRAKRQVSKECCATPCTLHYLIENYCLEATDQFKEYLSCMYSPEDARRSNETSAQYYFSVASIPFANQIRKEKAETTTRLAPRFGIYTSKNPYIFGHSSVNKTGQMNYGNLQQNHY